MGGPNNEFTNPIPYDTRQIRAELGAFCGVVSVTKQDLGVDLRSVLSPSRRNHALRDVFELTVPSLAHW